MDASNWLALAGLVSGITAFAAGLRQYTKAQEWKRAEFVAQQIKEFEANPAVRSVMYMLDWTNREVVLWQGGEPVWVTDAKICSSLEPHRDHRGGHGPVVDDPGHFEGDEAGIRDYFDVFLDYLERFDHFIEAGLVDAEGFRPYLEYWINSRLTPPSDLNDAVHSKQFFDTVEAYVEAYQYTGVRRLIERFSKYRRPPGMG